MRCPLLIGLSRSIRLDEDPEICDGLDNDCDGHIDEGNPADLCADQEPGPQTAGWLACEGGRCLPACAFGWLDTDPAQPGCERGYTPSAPAALADSALVSFDAAFGANPTQQNQQVVGAVLAGQNRLSLHLQGVNPILLIPQAQGDRMRTYLAPQLVVHRGRWYVVALDRSGVSLDTPAQAVIKVIRPTGLGTTSILTVTLGRAENIHHIRLMPVGDAMDVVVAASPGAGQVGEPQIGIARIPDNILLNLLTVDVQPQWLDQPRAASAFDVWAFGEGARYLLGRVTRPDELNQPVAAQELIDLNTGDRRVELGDDATLSQPRLMPTDAGEQLDFAFLDRSDHLMVGRLDPANIRPLIRAALRSERVHRSVGWLRSPLGPVLATAVDADNRDRCLLSFLDPASLEVVQAPAGAVANLPSAACRALAVAGPSPAPTPAFVTWDGDVGFRVYRGTLP